MTDDTCAHEVTGLLLSWRKRDVAALTAWFHWSHELRRMAPSIRRESAEQPMRATALVHELFP
jgi:hypothetical protein